MITLNLNSQHNKQELFKEKLISLAKDVVFVILFVVLINSIYIFISKQILNKNFAEIESQKNLIKIQNQPFNKQVANINSKMKSVDQIQKNYIKWSNLLIDFNDLVADDVQLTSIDIDQNKNLFRISGYAKKRENFLELKESLENSDLFENIESPLSNILKKTDLNWELSANLKYVE